VAGRTFFGTVRLAILVAVLAFVALGAWLDRRRSTDWDDALRVTIYPVAAGADPATTSYVERLDAAAFADVADFLAAQAGRYGVSLEEPVRVRVSHAVRDLPPAGPDEPGLASVALWSLHMRYWAWRVAADDPLPPPDVQVFAVYRAADGRHVAPDSTGLQKGLVAVTHLYAGPASAGSNAVVLTHELLHTLGATDKYDRATGQPVAPGGLGDPSREPLYPQDTGEIMAGRVAVSANEAVVPDSLGQMTVSPLTAREIGWSR
jgi:hypothetical protein